MSGNQQHKTDTEFDRLMEDILYSDVESIDEEEFDRLMEDNFGPVVESADDAQFDRLVDEFSEGIEYNMSNIYSREVPYSSVKELNLSSYCKNKIKQADLISITTDFILSILPESELKK
jgi:hypothetical protein